MACTVECINEVYTQVGCGVTVTGTGEAVDPLVIDTQISAEGGNILECCAEGESTTPGLYVPEPWSDRASMERTNPQVIPASAGAGIVERAQIEYDLSNMQYGNFNVNFGPPSSITILDSGVYLLRLQEHDTADPINAFIPGAQQVTVGIQIEVNGVVAAEHSQPRMWARTNYLECSRIIEAGGGEVVTGWFYIVDEVGATVPHQLDLNPFGNPVISSLQIVRLGSIERGNCADEG